MLYGLIDMDLKAGFSPTSAQSAAFLARATNIVSNTDKINYDTMITGLVNDGVWAKLDVLYIFATVDRTTAVLNLVGTSFPCIENGTVNFSAYHGYTGDGSTFFLNTQLAPNVGGTNYSINSTSMGVYQISSNTTVHSWMMGENHSNQTGIEDRQSGGEIGGWCTSDIVHPVEPNSQGFWINSQINNTTHGLSRNGGVYTTNANTPGALDDLAFYIFCLHDNTGPIVFSSQQFSSAFIGGGFSQTDVGNMSNRINTFMTAYGINVYP